MSLKLAVGASKAAALVAAIAATAAIVSGCGDDAAGTDGPTVTQSITREFGRQALAPATAMPLEGHRTVLRLLRESATVDLTVGGRVVTAIDGLAMTQSPRAGAEETTWALNVNGIEADEWPREYRLYPGDNVQWDLRDWYVTLDVRATVGAFPETFARGSFGRRFPVTVECSERSSRACRSVRGALVDAGVDPDGARPPGPRPGEGLVQRARILVGPWERWRGRPWAGLLDRGPRWSGVFARFSPAGDELRLLDWNSHRRSARGAGTGLVGAIRPTEEDLLWLVTGVDDAGVERAAAALADPDLRDAFAAVVDAEGIEKVPLPPPSGD